ncbi:hypothetical protein HMPREF1982_01222 [Clostridiales bacterium oral taxon 876 str. F0540]|nr:hypothetical protein HMPREF1982_01222 [Clostridiales bacterium oral taxon 876 str. F0540]
MKLLKKITSFILILSVLVIAPTYTKKVHAQTISTSTSQLYTIINRRTGKELHNTADNRVVVYNGAGNSNMWYFVKSPDDPYSYKIVNLRTGLSLHNTSDNRVVTYADCGDSNDWILTGTSDSNYLQIVNVRTGLSLHNTSDDRVVTYDYCGDSNDWLLVPVYYTLN